MQINQFMRDFHSNFKHLECARNGSAKQRRMKSDNIRWKLKTRAKEIVYMKPMMNARCALRHEQQSIHDTFQILSLQIQHKSCEYD